MTTRSDMSGALSLDRNSPTKSFVLEVHTDEPARYLADLVGHNSVEDTDDAYVFRVHVADQTFWVDQLEDRFWTFHTDMPAGDAFNFLRDRVEQRRELDWMWLPSDHLRYAWPNGDARQVRTSFEGRGFLGDDSAARDLKVRLAGQHAEHLLELISSDPRYSSAVSFESVQTTIVDPDLGTVTEGVNRMGRFAVVGDSFELHLAFIRTVVTHYRRFVELCEQKSVVWTSFTDGGGTVQGGPIVLKFSRHIPDLDRFVSELLAVRRPFRLWGIPEFNGGVAEIEAVDLHVGQRLRLDISDDWMRVYLDKGSCGNTIARLVSNLQRHFDGALTLLDPELQEASSARSRSIHALSN